MPLNSLVHQHLDRLGIGKPENARGNAIELLVQHVAWPRTLDCSLDRVRSRLIEHGVPAADWHADDVTDRAPFYSVDIQLGAADVPWESYGLEWPTDFPDVDLTAVTLFGYDPVDMYLLAENPGDPTDPLLFIVPLERLAGLPRSLDLTVSEFLSLLG